METMFHLLRLNQYNSNSNKNHQYITLIMYFQSKEIEYITHFKFALFLINHSHIKLQVISFSPPMQALSAYIIVSMFPLQNRPLSIMHGYDLLISFHIVQTKPHTYVLNLFYNLLKNADIFLTPSMRLFCFLLIIL